MDYEKLAVAIKLCGSTPKVDQCPQCPYWASGDMNNCIPRVTADAATAITNLLARAEAAEARAEKAEMERDAAVAQLHGHCPACKNYTLNHNEGPYEICKHEYYQYRDAKAVDNWEWRGEKMYGGR